MKRLMMRFGFEVFCCLILSSLSMGQATIPNAADTRVAGQLLYYFDMAAYDVGYLTLTNTGLEKVPLHIQLQTSDCQELLNFRIIQSASCSRVYNLRRFELPGGQYIDLVGLKGFLTITPVSSGIGTAAVPYNHLAGNIVQANSSQRNSYGLNAIARLAVDTAGNPLPDFAGTLDGVARRFQRIQPNRLYQDSIFSLDNLTDSRLVLISFTDNYLSNGYFISSGGIDPDYLVQMRGFATTSDCSRFSLPDKPAFTCIFEATLVEFLGAASSSFRQTSGFLELGFSAYQPYQNIVGIGFQTLGPYADTRYLWGK